jgi:hypothetical protein
MMNSQGNKIARVSLDAGGMPIKSEAIRPSDHDPTLSRKICRGFGSGMGTVDLEQPPSGRCVYSTLSRCKISR